MVLRVRFSRRAECPARDLTCGDMGKYMTLEEAVRAYMSGGVVNLPEGDPGDYEFDKAPAAHELRGDNIAPTYMDKCDVAAELNSQEYARVFPQQEPTVTAQPESVAPDPAPAE